MQIGFWLTTNRRIDVNKLEQTPFGGCEIEALNLAKELHRFYSNSKKSHPITIFCNVDEPSGIYGQALFLRYSDLPKLLASQGLDILIAVRAQKEVLSPRYAPLTFGSSRPKKLVLWSGDSFDQSNNECLYDRWTLKNIDQIVLKSGWQKEVWLSAFSQLEINKVKIIRKGVDLDSLPKEPSVTDKPRFIYASVAFRGLARFLEIWPKIKEKIPAATLDCYCKTTLYDDSSPQEEQHQNLYRQLSALPGISIKEPLPQKEFFKILPTYYAMLYPNCGFDETVCGVALESMACGVPVVTSARAGLIETVKAGDGILIDEDPTTTAYADKFVDAACDLWHRKENRNWMGEYGFRKIRERYGIRDTAKEWQQLIDSLNL